MLTTRRCSAARADMQHNSPRETVLAVCGGPRDWMQCPIGRIPGFSLRRGFHSHSHYESFWLFPIQVSREGLSRGGCMLQPAGCYLAPILEPGTA